jgi:DNA-binding CsgD family transcriptional regulator
MSESIFLKFGSFEVHDNICHLYSHESECLEIGTKFIVHGISNRNKCIFICDGKIPTSFNERLMESGLDLSKLRKNRDFEELNLNTHKKEIQDPKSFAKFIRDKIENTFNVGRNIVRILISNKHTYLTYSHTELLLKKILLDKMSEEKPVILMNQYEIDKLTSRDIVNLLKTHSKIIIDEHLYKSPFYIPPRTLLKELNQERSKYDDLTPKEKTILRYIVRGLSNKNIAQELSISIKTVETHRANIMNKLDIHKLVDLVKFGIKNRII